MSETMVLVHGFSGTRRAWDAVAAGLAERYRPLAIDLPGHGEAAAVRPAGIPACVAHVLARAPERFAITGYSMGGRVALNVALTAPDRVTRLGLVSTSAGIADADERARRRAADEQLAQAIESEGVEAFAARWAQQPLFAGQTPEVARLAHEDRLRNGAEGLAASLRAAGAGAMMPVWERLHELGMPALVIAGRRDTKYLEIARRLTDHLARGRLVEIADAGHAVHLERSGAVAAALRGSWPD